MAFYSRLTVPIRGTDFALRFTVVNIAIIESNEIIIAVAFSLFSPYNSEPNTGNAIVLMEIAGIPIGETFH